MEMREEDEEDEPRRQRRAARTSGRTPVLNETRSPDLKPGIGIWKEMGSLQREATSSSRTNNTSKPAERAEGTLSATAC